MSSYQSKPKYWRHRNYNYSLSKPHDHYFQTKKDYNSYYYMPHNRAEYDYQDGNYMPHNKLKYEYDYQNYQRNTQPDYQKYCNYYNKRGDEMHNFH